MDSITEVSIIHHVGIVLLLLWLLSSFNFCYPLAYFLSLIYLYLVNDRYSMRLRRKVQFEERRQAHQKRVLSDSESVRWLNHAVEKMWPVCVEQIVSQKILLPIIPWFLQKYKPWTVKDCAVQQLYLGRSPPMFTGMRVLSQSTDDDHLVLELGINFRTADDMSAILAVKLTKRLGFGMLAKMHLTGMHVEGKVLVGVKFLHKWPFLSRLRVCFVEPPYFQMTVKPIFSHGFDVTELPGIAGWLDKLLTLVFEETLVEPNMLVVDVEKFVSPEPDTGNWFSVDAKEPIAYALVEVVEASDMKPSDLNGLADPYVKGQLGAYRFRTKTQKKTLSPKWHEEFKIPICTWESTNVLAIEVRDKDHFVDDSLGGCSINISELRDGQRHDMWLPLQNIKMGRLHIAIRVIVCDIKGTEEPCDGETLNNECKRNSFASDKKVSFSSALSEDTSEMADRFEPIDIEGQEETGIWVHHPGIEVPQKWEARKGKNRLVDSGDSVRSIKSSAPGSSQNDSSSSTDESLDGHKTKKKNAVQRGLHKMSSVFHRSPKMGNEKSSDVDSTELNNSNCFNEPTPSPRINLRAVSEKAIGVNLVLEDNLSSRAKDREVEVRESPDGNGPESPNRKNVKDMAKGIFKHAGKSARSMKHVLSGKHKGELPPVLTQRDLVGESDSSNEESVPSPVHKPEAEASSAPISVGGGDPLESDERPVQTSVNEPSMDSVIPIGGPAMSTVDPVDKVKADGLGEVR